MSILRHLTGLSIVMLTVSPVAFAQEQPPLIVLDPPTSLQGEGEAPEAAQESETPPVAEASPQIQLPSSALPQPDTASAKIAPQIPERDRGAEIVPAEMQPWLVPLTPAKRLPATMQTGASQSEPGILRLTGEVATAELQLELPENTEIPPELMLMLRSSVNILPEVSAFTISINDATPTVLPLTHLNGFEIITVSAAGLQPGSNQIRIDVRQPHRIYCGPEASFSVWTDIDLGRSGVPVEAEKIASSRAGFASALAAHIATGRPLPILVDTNDDRAPLRQLAEMLGQSSGGRALVEFRSFYGLGATSPLSVALIASDRSHAEFREGAAGGLVLQVEHVNGTLPPLDEYLPALPPKASSVPPLIPGRTTSLADLNQQDIVGGTRYFRQEVPFTLPQDWLLLSNQKARLQLQYGFSDALPQGSMLLVKINDKTVQLLPLDREGGKLQEPLDIAFAANLLHGGHNGLVFEMMVPGNPPDAICPPRRADMLVITSDTTLLVPPAPNMSLGGLSEPLSRLGSGGLIVPEGVSDRLVLERSAAELSAGLASDPDTHDPTVHLNLVGVKDSSLLPFEGGQASARDLQEALINSGFVSTAAVPASPVQAAPRYRLTEEDPAPANTLLSPLDSNDLAVADWISEQIGGLKSAAFMGSEESLSAWLEEREGIALLLRPRPQEANDLWLVLGPEVSVPTVLQGLVRLRDSGLAKGEAAILTEDGSWDVWAPVQPPKMHEPLRLSNLRTVLGNYSSWSPLLFTVTFLGLAILSSIPALLFILFTRRRGQL